MKQPLHNKRHRYFIASVFLSVVLHWGAVLFLQAHSLWFYSKPDISRTVFKERKIDKRQRDAVLEKSFAALQKQKADTSPPPKLETAAQPIEALPQPNPLLVPPSHQIAFSCPPLEIGNEELFSLRSPPLPLLSSIDLTSLLPRELATLPLHAFPPPSLPGTEIVAAQLYVEVPTIPSSSLDRPLAFADPAANPTPLRVAEEELRATPPIALPVLPQLPTLAELETSNLSDYFESDLVFLPQEEGSGYIFALTLIPRPDLKLEKFRHHVTFLIDRSNSVQKERLTATRQAVQKALHELFADDSFNIVAFDSKTEKLFPILTATNSYSLSKAEDFLEQIQLGSFFSPGDPYRALLLTVPGQVEDDELHSTVLITDGESLSKKGMQRALLRTWTDHNQGRVSLFTIAMGSDHHLATLDAMSVFNKGKLTYATTNRGLRRKLLKLMKTIRSPIAKNLAVTAISLAPDAKIEIFPKPLYAPHLYLDHPYVIVGSTETLNDFVLFVQGRVKGGWLNIKKTLSFVNAKKGGNTLRSEWALHKAYLEYEKFTQDDNPLHLAEARAILEPYNLQLAFE